MTVRHPLQRLASPSRSLSLVVHASGIVSFLLSFKYLHDNPDARAVSFWSHFQFLTILGLASALLSFVFGLLADLTLSPALFAAKNVVSVCAAPLEVLISLLYWGISAIDKSLVFPVELQLPFLPDFGFHAMPAVMLAIDLLFFSPPWTVQGYGFAAISTAIAIGYWRWVEYCYSSTGWYPYPMFDILSTEQRIALFGFAALLMTASSMALKWTYGKINGYPQIQRGAANPLKVD